jgi:hypothetical protein
VSRGLFAIACVALFGCPGDDAGAGTAGASPEAADPHAAMRLCDAHLAWDMGCAAMEPAPRTEPFWGETECLDGPWHYVPARYIDAVVDCFASLGCDSFDDECISAGFAALGIDDEADLADNVLYQRCLELAGGCDALNDDVCLNFAVFVEEGQKKIAPCLDLECGGIQDCLLHPG